MGLRIGSGSAWWGDRITPAAASAEHGNLDYLCFETMAEATISAAQVKKRQQPEFNGYDTHLEERFNAVLKPCLENGTKIISNQGWINPIGAAEKVRALLNIMGYQNVKIAAVTGSLISDSISKLTYPIIENQKFVSDVPGEIISAEVYLGADPIVEALNHDADIVLTGRVADPSLFLAPMMYEFGWKQTDTASICQGSGIGHLLECGAQITGGYFLDPGFKEISEPWNLAFPIAEVEADGSAIISKIENSGGVINRRTVLEQMFYEVHDPRNYITPDCVVDFSTAVIEEVSKNKVAVKHIGGKSRTDTLKVSLGVLEGFIGQDMFFFAGPGCLEKAKIAKDILEKRFRIIGVVAEDIRIDFIGINAIHGPISPEPCMAPYEVGIRVAGRTQLRTDAEKICAEIDSMAVSGLSGTGKSVPFGERVREVIGLWSTLIDRNSISPSICYI